MDDLISRQDAIDAVKSYWKAEVDAIPKDADFGTVTATCNLILKCNTEMCKVLDGIPSAQPERDTGYSDGFTDGYKAGQKEAQPEPQWIPCSEQEYPNDNREVEVTCEFTRYDGKKIRYTCHASYVHRYSIDTAYGNWEDCEEYNEEKDMYYALPGWYERVHNWDDYSYCNIEDRVVAWRELPEPWKGEQK